MIIILHLETYIVFQLQRLTSYPPAEHGVTFFRFVLRSCVSGTL